MIVEEKNMNSFCGQKRFRALRVFSCALCISLLAAVAAGCQPSDGPEKSLDPQNPVAIEVWHYYNGPQKSAFDAMVNEFNETVGVEKGIVVESFSQGNISDLTDKVLDAANKKVGASDIPDIFAAYADTAYAVDKVGLVAKLDDYLTTEELSEYVDGYIDEGRLGQDSSLKIFPVAKSTEVFMMNKTDWDKFAAATGASADDLATYEGVTKTAKKYYEWTDSQTDALDDGKAFFGRDAMANYFVIGFKQLGKDIFQVEDGKVRFNLDEDILKRLWDNYYIPTINGYFASYGKFRSDDAKTGDIIALIGSTSGAAYFPRQVVTSDTESYPIDVVTMPTPLFEGAEPYAVQQGAGMVVSKSDTAHEYASVVFLKWFTETSRNIEFSAGSGYLPVKKAANDKALIEGALSKLEDNTVSANLKTSLPIGVDLVNNYTMYTNKAFENGTKARDVLEYSLSDKAKEDLEQIAEMMKQGLSRQEAVAKYETEENFQSWLAALRQALDKTQS